LGDAVLAAQTRQHDADLFLCRELPPGGPPDRLDNLLCRFLHRPGSLSHLRSFNGYDGPEILPSSTRPFCLTGADAGHVGLSPESKAAKQFRLGLRDAGFSEGHDIVIEWRSANGDYDRVPTLVADLLQRKVDVI